jgi:crotonobetainyl-CoA:carnitine CoA-transferase CaiB-like acyl-CoA transferase
MSIGGPPEGPSFKTGVAIVDVVAGLHTTIGVLAALVERAKSGRGQRIRISLMQSALASLVNQASGYLGAGAVPSRLGNAHPSIAPYEPFEAGDTDFIIAVGNDRQFAGLCTVLGLEDLAEDEGFATNSARVENRHVLHASIEAVTRGSPAATWIERLAAEAVPCGPINQIDAAFGMATRLGLDPVVSIDGFDAVRSPLGLERTPVTYRSPPPDLGDGDDAIRAWLSS